jgi:teichuronic acid biosynthesis glycosyltransferase TuaH
LLLEGPSASRDGQPSLNEPDGGLVDVVFVFTSATWTDAQERSNSFTGDRLCQTLLAHPRVRRLLVANPFRSAPVRVARRLAGQREAAFPADARCSLYQPLRIRRHDPPGLRALERSYRDYGNRLRRAASRAGLVRPSVISMHPLVAGFAEFHWAERVTWYAEDDWAAVDQYRRWWSGIEEAYGRIRERGFPVCAVSQAIIDRLSPTGPSCVVPNGIDPKEWLDPAPGPAWFEALPRPRILYFGSLDRRLDRRSLNKVASRFEEGSVALVGPMADERHVAPLASLRNVHVMPTIPASERSSLVMAADVCVIPHIRTPLTEAMSPLKLYEYLAGGRPVVATDLPSIRGVDEHVELVGDDEDFGAAVARALARRPASEEDRLSFLAANSWQGRHELVLGLALG